jgi:transposase
MSSTATRKAYPSDVSDDEWSLVVPYLTLMKENAPQREYPLRELFNALRYVIRYGIAWRAMPNDFPPWHAVHQQAHRWQGRVDRRDHRQPNAALDAGKWHPRRL